MALNIALQGGLVGMVEKWQVIENIEMNWKWSKSKTMRDVAW